VVHRLAACGRVRVAAQLRTPIRFLRGDRVQRVTVVDFDSRRDGLAGAANTPEAGQSGTLLERQSGVPS